MQDKSSVLVLGRASAAVRVLVERLQARGSRVTVVESLERAVHALVTDGADLLVYWLDVDTLPPGDVLVEVRRLDPKLDIIVAGSAPGFGPAEAMELGAFDYVPEPGEHPGALLSAVGLALGARHGDVQLRYLRDRDAAKVSFDAIVGAHPSMQRTFERVRHFCARTLGGGAPTILLLGETGTGKGLIAKAIHYNSARRSEPFVEVNCAAIPASLIESELFGYERGAFTDAKSSRAGLFETAQGGTLFLDEIGSLPVSVQAKLLTAIEEKRVRRIGARQSIIVDVQIIAASHPVLGQAVREGQFREDLYHRLNVVSIELPPLRERGGDRLELARAFAVEFCRKYGMPARQFSDDAEAFIESYAWPGNVRELRNQIERIVLLLDEPIITASQFDSRLSTPPPASSSSRSARSETIAPPKSDRHPSRSRRGNGSFELELPQEGIALDELERQAIKQALERCRGNVSAAARFLSISRQTLMYRMKKHGIRLSARQPRESALPRVGARER